MHGSVGLEAVRKTRKPAGYINPTHVLLSFHSHGIELHPVLAVRSV